MATHIEKKLIARTLFTFKRTLSERKEKVEIIGEQKLNNQQLLEFKKRQA